MNTIGELIRRRREELRLSQESMADYLHITQSNYSRLEKDDKRLTAPKIQKIAEVLKLNIAYLFGEQAAQVINQNNNDNVNAYNVENLYQSNKEITDKLIEQYEGRLAEKNDLINILKKSAVI